MSISDSDRPNAGRAPATIRHRNLPLLLLQARERVVARFRPLLKRYDITEQQWRIIRILLEQAPLEPRQIGACCGISSPSMAGVLDRMERVGLVGRRRLARDQRRIHVSLTARSKRLAAAIAPEINAIYMRIQDQLGQDLWLRVQTTLEELVMMLDKPCMDERADPDAVGPAGKPTWGGSRARRGE